MMKALVTGGHGFIGSFLVEKLLKEGWSVRCLVRKSSNLQWIKNYPVERVVGDVTDPMSLPKAVTGVDVIYHVAAVLTGVNEESYFAVNCKGSLDLAEAALRWSPNLKRFVFISSVAASGPHIGTEKVSEQTKEQPVSVYGKSKLEAEKSLKKKFPTLPLTIIRPPMVYGPRDQHFLALFKFAKYGVFPVPAPYKRYYSIVHVNDLVDGIYNASLNARALGQTYFMCNPEFYTLEGLAKTLSIPFSKQPKFIYIPGFLIKGLAVLGDIYSVLMKKDMMLTSKKVPEIMASSWVFSSEKANRDLQFEIKVPMAQGVQQTVQWYQEHHYL